MENVNLFAVSTSLLVITLVILAWIDAIRNDKKLSKQFLIRFKKGIRLGVLLSVCAIGIGYANALQPGNQKVSITQFIFISILGGSLATVEIGVLNGLNPNPINSKSSILKRLVKIGWAGAIGIVGFTAVYLPYKISELIF